MNETNILTNTFTVFDEKNNITNNTKLINAEAYIDDILKSYKYDPKLILDQVIVDYPRVSIHVNGVKMNTVYDFYKKLQKFNKCIYKHNYTDKNNNGTNDNNGNNNNSENNDNSENNKKKYIRDYNFLTILLMLCCQSSYGYQYYDLHERYCTDNKMKMIPEGRYLLCSSNRNRVTKFTISDDKISVDIDAELVIKDIVLSTVVMTIDTKLIIDSDINNNTQIYKFNEYGCYCWST